jgi:thiamine-phosphate pyrophosphorylase
MRPQERVGSRSFSLIVITSPLFFDGEADCLKGMLEAGLSKLHVRKFGAREGGIEKLLDQLPDRWYPRLVLHGRRDLAVRYGIPQIHCSAKEWREDTAGVNDQTEEMRERIRGKENGGEVKAWKEKRAGMKVSVSLHSWKELDEMDTGIEYAFLSPLFDSISKPGYQANPGLLERPPGPHPCKVIGLGGIDKDTILPVIEHGWDGAALLGWIWEEPGAAVERYVLIQKLIDTYRL